MENKTINHVAIIMDGNGRWAVKRGLKRTSGHKEGYKRLKEIGSYILQKGVKVLSVFAFSTENFKRSSEEVNFLMKLFETGFKKDAKFFVENNIKVVFSSIKEPLSDSVYNSMLNLQEKTKNCTGGILNICLNYGGQSEIVDACKKIAMKYKNDEVNLDDINTTNFHEYLYNDLPQVDLLIRTSGEIRISNFMLYSLSYSELYFTKTCFPDFDKEEVDKAFDEYFKRNITKGNVK